MKEKEFEKCFAGLSSVIKDGELREWYKNLIKICMEDEAQKFSEWLAENHYHRFRNGTNERYGKWKQKFIASHQADFFTTEQLYNNFQKYLETRI